MTRLYLDTEFNGHGGFLISLALICPDGRQFYEALACDDMSATIDPWVVRHVVPNLGKNAISRREFQMSFHAFLLRFDDPEVICDWHADAEHFCAMLRGASYEYSLDYAFRLKILRTPPGQPVSLSPHNALADARALMEWNEARLAA